MNTQKDAGKMKEERNLFLQLSDSSFSFNPIQTGGGGAIVPALTLDFYTFFHKQAKPAKLGDFS